MLIFVRTPFCKRSGKLQKIETVRRRGERSKAEHVDSAVAMRVIQNLKQIQTGRHCQVVFFSRAAGLERAYFMIANSISVFPVYVCVCVVA